MSVSPFYHSPCCCIDFVEPALVGDLGSSFEPALLVALPPEHVASFVVNETEEVQAFANRTYLRFMRLEAQLLQKCCCHFHLSLDLALRLAEYDEIVKVSDVKVCLGYFL